MKIRLSLYIIATFLMIQIMIPDRALSWGGRGHHVVCSAAVHLVKEPGLKEFLRSRGHTMGHLCNVPDIYWKSLTSPEARAGNPAHYINPEKLGVPLAQIPLDWKRLNRQFQGKKNFAEPEKKILSIAEEVGSLWWRVAQFHDRVASQKSVFAKAKPPADRQQEQNDDLLYNQAVYNLMVNLGLMGHFVGDAAQPLHNSADFDGYGTGNGGLHFYYEEGIISAAPADLESRVFQAASSLENHSWLKKGSTLERMRSFSEFILADLDELRKLDPVLEKSVDRREKGMNLRTPAKRASFEEGWKKLEPLAIKHMSHASRLLAALWDESYRAAGKPDLSKYRSYRYPFTPDFVEVKY